MVPEEELVRRLDSRSICRLCGTGATVGAQRRRGVRQVRRPAGAADRRQQSVVLERLKVYHRQSEPLVEYYRVRPTFRSIDGAQAPDRVAADLAAAIAAAGNGAAGVRG